MHPVLQQLVDLLTLERIAPDLFRGQSEDFGNVGVFGGQVLGQAVMAAGATVDGPRMHSLHAYFLRPGNPKAPIEYEVDRARDGRSFATRRVRALQHGQNIFNLSASFHAVEEGPRHATSMPDVASPDGLLNETELRDQRLANKGPEPRRVPVHDLMPIEMRMLQPLDPFDPERAPPVAQWWMRAIDRLPDDPVLHRALLAWASDYGFIRTAFRPHGLNFVQPDVQIVSLDHALWFHDDFRMDDWILHATDGPVAAHGRGYARGQLFTRDGRLVASSAQEGLARVKPQNQPAAFKAGA